MCIMHHIERWKEWENERVCYVLAVLNGRAYQTRFKSEQPMPAAPGMLVYFIYFGLYYTHKRNKQVDVSYGNESEELLTNKKLDFGLFGTIRFWRQAPVKY